MQLFVVHPNLEVSDCDSAPSDATINERKERYLHNLRKYRRLIHRLANDPSIQQIPAWCLTRDTESNVSEILRQNSRNSSGDVDSPEPLELGSPGSKGSAGPALTGRRRRSSSTTCALKLESISDVCDLPLETIRLTPDDELPFKQRRGDRNPDGTRVEYMLPRLNLPHPREVTQQFKDFLAVKYFQLTTDMSLVEFKYLQVYSKINRTIKKYFSAPELTPEMEDEGFTKVNAEMELFKGLENVLVRLRRLKLEFEDHYGKYYTAEQSRRARRNPQTVHAHRHRHNHSHRPRASATPPPASTIAL